MLLLIAILIPLGEIKTPFKTSGIYSENWGNVFGKILISKANWILYDNHNPNTKTNNIHKPAWHLQDIHDPW